ncbi:DMT family transporter [Neobacillus rhizophilus]|uniref:DMT family transporter n=1 Tax=Neobacillus rhizophilus TaxID=2833579 RepID=A0A942U5A8_9BACI|nr:DMT family transporter [Neobacillus rhizophilus]MBS4212978.1 DMT family transporter [Neobacillus rhizophilus]MBU8918194.1 DMT family transporter [Bacillus sp. FJAT-29953]
MNIKALTIALFTVMIWGASFPAIRVILHGGYSPGHLILTRYLIASALFAIYALWPGVKFRLPQKGDILKIAILGFVGISIYHIGVAFGEKTVNAGVAAMLISSTPIFTALIALFVLRERLGLFGWIGLGLGFLGIGIIALETAGSSFHISSGVFLLLIASLGTSVMFAFQKPLLRRYSSIELTAYFTWVGTIPFFIYFPGYFQELQHASLDAHLSAIYLGIFPTAIGYVTWTIALSLGKSGSVMSMIYFEPVFAILIAWIWINEQPSFISIIGGAVAIAGVIVVNTLGSKKNTPAIEPVGVQPPL